MSTTQGCSHIISIKLIKLVSSSPWKWWPDKFIHTRHTKLPPTCVATSTLRILEEATLGNLFFRAHFGYGLVPRPNKLQPLKPSTRSKACALKTQNRYLLQLSELTLLSRSEDGEHVFFSNHSWSYTSYFDFPLVFLVFLMAEKMTKKIIITKKLGVQNMFIVATRFTQEKRNHSAFSQTSCRCHCWLRNKHPNYYQISHWV